MILIKMTKWFSVILKINETDKTKLSDPTKFKLDEIKKIETYFHKEINQRKLSSKKLLIDYLCCHSKELKKTM